MDTVQKDNGYKKRAYIPPTTDPKRKQTKGPNININYICTMEYCFNPQPSHNLKMTEIWADVMSRSPYHLW